MARPRPRPAVTTGRRGIGLAEAVEDILPFLQRPVAGPSSEIGFREHGAATGRDPRGMAKSAGRRTDARCLRRPSSVLRSPHSPRCVHDVGILRRRILPRHPSTFSTNGPRLSRPEGSGSRTPAGFRSAVPVQWIDAGRIGPPGGRIATGPAAPEGSGHRAPGLPLGGNRSDGMTFRKRKPPCPPDRRARPAGPGRDGAGQAIVVTARSASELADDLEYLIKSVAPDDDPTAQAIAQRTGELQVGGDGQGPGPGRGFGLAVSLPRDFPNGGSPRSWPRCRSRTSGSSWTRSRTSGWRSTISPASPGSPTR